MTHELLSKLAEPFDPVTVTWRVGSTTADKKRGMALAYIDARDVMNRLDAVCGPGGWQCDYPWGDGKRVVCRIGVKIDDEWVWKADGAGDTDYEGEKGALSDAFKRAAVRWGIGRYLYDVDAPWVAIEAMGKSFKILDSELPKLHAKLPRPEGSPAPKRPAPTEKPRTTELSRLAVMRDEIAKCTSLADVDAWWRVHVDEIANMPETSEKALYAAARDRKRDLRGVVPAGAMP